MANVHEWDADDYFFEMLHPAWHAEAACRGMDPSIFYPETNTGSFLAVTVCDGCPVRGPCAEAGDKESLGVWGGRVRTERRIRQRVGARRG